MPVTLRFRRDNPHEHFFVRGSDNSDDTPQGGSSHLVVVARAPERIPESEWTDPRHLLGVSGEREAMQDLTSRGWRIEAHRFRTGRHDIDLIIRKGTLVAFVEVKTRSSGEFGSGVESVGWKKRKAVAWAAAVWVARHGEAGDRYRFDVVTVRPGSAGPRVDHLEDAWRP